MSVVSVVCAYCSNELGSGQRFRLGGQMVCAPCAKRQTTETIMNEPSDNHDQGFDALAAAAAASARRPGTTRKPVKKSGMSVGVIAFAIATVALCGASVYVVQSGMLKGWMGQSNQAVAIEAENNVINQYNALVATGNQLANAREYTKAVQKFREAHAVVTALPAVKKSVNLAELEGIISRCESMAQAARQPAGAPAAGPATPTPANVQFMEKPEPNVVSNEAPAGKEAPTPSRLFKDIPADGKTAAKPAAKPHKDEPGRIDAYKKP